MRRSLTPQEAKLWQQLKSKQLGVTFRRQYLIADKYIVDFICLKHKLIIEVDGSQHADNLQDVVRTAFLNQRGFKILRFWDHEIDTNLDGCLRLVKTKLQK